MSDQDAQRIIYPWQEDAKFFLIGNLACGNMRENLLKWLNIKGRIHAETLLMVIGAVVGFAAQQAALEKISTMHQNNQPVHQHAIVLFGLKSGNQFLFGDEINYPLIGGNGNKFALWNFAVGAVISSGKKLGEIPDIAQTLRRISENITADNFGLLDIDEKNKPQLSVLDALKIFWPRTEEVFRLKPPGPAIESAKDLPKILWPSILSLVANQLLTSSINVLDPLIGYKIVIEAAIYASKINPDLITPGCWSFATDKGFLKVYKK